MSSLSLPERTLAHDPGRVNLLPGLALALAVGSLATLLGRVLPLVGGPVLAIAAGVLIASTVRLPASTRAGLAFAGSTILQASIVVSGFGISLVTVLRTGVASLPVTFVTLLVAGAGAYLLGRLLRLDAAITQLVGVGTAICGASAIAAVATVIAPAEADVALSIATIFAYNLIAVFVFPAIGHALHLSQSAFGLWAGTAINDTSSVVAAAFAYGLDAGRDAIVVKLARATLILPIVAGFALVAARRARAQSARVPWRKIVPWFILWFLAAALVASGGLVPDAWHPQISAVAGFLICVALAGIGMQTRPAQLVRTGTRPLLLGGLLWVAVAASSLAVQRIIGR